IKGYINDKKFSSFDTIINNSQDSKEFKKYLILSKLRSIENKYRFNIDVEKTTSPFLELEKLQTTFEIDFEKLNIILQSSKSNFIEDSIKYGNYINTEYKYIKKIRYDYLAIAIFIVLAYSILNFFINRIGLKSKNNVQDTIENIKTDKSIIDKVQKVLNRDRVTQLEIDHLKKLVDRVRDNLEKYKFDNVSESILYIDTVKAERKSIELYNRSTLMLILGLLIAVVGIVVFYFTLPEINDVKDKSNYFILIIRPSLILIFIQSISFYLLKQYRSLINDYKYFHEEYIQKSNIFISHQLMQNEKINEFEEKLIIKLLSSESKDINYINENDISQMPADKLLEMLKSIIDKVKI
ncbi:hypothetical protein, partial [Flavobacterium sp.]|uniref:hypothetical protein n=1 Tax=Flavobacterium sp. TaxID=239 RepID=UPI002619C2E7